LKRLFLSLYVFIVCGLFAINLISELIWEQITVDDTEQVAQTKKVVELLPKLITHQQRDLQHISDALQVPVTVHSLYDFAWLEEQLIELNTGRSVVIFNDADRPVFYVKIPNELNVYQLGPFSPNEPPPNQAVYKWLVLGFSYLLLAAVIAFWIRPLWRDLTQLKSMAHAIAQGNLDVTSKRVSKSPIHHVVTTFHQMSRRVKRLLDDQTHLVNAVSHELRTPLSRLRFALAIVPTSDANAVKEMGSDIKEIETLVDEMLGYARLENVNQSIECEMVDLSDVVTNQVNKLAQHQQIEFVKNIPENCHYQCNQKLIDRALQNLLTNAVRYAFTKVTISLVVKDNNNIQLIVEDDGIGISESEYSQVFKPFYRLNDQSSQFKENTSTKGGVGLGLAIVQRICDWHNAKYWVEKSNLGGCKFVLSFSLSK